MWGGAVQARHRQLFLQRMQSFTSSLPGTVDRLGCICIAATTAPMAQRAPFAQTQRTKVSTVVAIWARKNSTAARSASARHVRPGQRRVCRVPVHARLPRGPHPGPDLHRVRGRQLQARDGQRELHGVLQRDDDHGVECQRGVGLRMQARPDQERERGSTVPAVCAGAVQGRGSRRALRRVSYRVVCIVAGRRRPRAV